MWRASGYRGRSRHRRIRNGLKSDVTITNCDVYGNNCCGIELQDGTAWRNDDSGNNVHDNGDNGMGLTGMGGAVGPTIANNIITNNGRYGIEVKMPDGNGTDTGAGSVVVEDNTVSFTASPATTIVDHRVSPRSARHASRQCERQRGHPHRCGGARQ